MIPWLHLSTAIIIVIVTIAIIIVTSTIIVTIVTMVSVIYVPSNIVFFFSNIIAPIVLVDTTGQSQARHVSFDPLSDKQRSRLDATPSDPS